MTLPYFLLLPLLCSPFICFIDHIVRKDVKLFFSGLLDTTVLWLGEGQNGCKTIVWSLTHLYCVSYFTTDDPNFRRNLCGEGRVTEAALSLPERPLSDRERIERVAGMKGRVNCPPLRGGTIDLPKLFFPKNKQKSYSVLCPYL